MYNGLIDVEWMIISIWLIYLIETEFESKILFIWDIISEFKYYNVAKVW